MLSYRRFGAAVLLLVTLAWTGTACAAPPPPAWTTSHYVVLGDDASADKRHGHETGCADGRSGAPGLRLLLFGTQEPGNQLRPPGMPAASPAKRVPMEQVQEVARAWIDGFVECRRDAIDAIVALGVTNRSDGGADPSAAGAQWAAMVERVGRDVSASRITVAGAIDAEPSWSPPGWAREWVDAFAATSPRALYTAGSADGCPQQGAAPGACSNGWTVADVHYVATGAARTVLAVPQIYRTDGVQARQWAWISSWGVRNGVGPLRVAAALSQQQACAQRGCRATDNSPTAARAQLVEALAMDPATRVSSSVTATDMVWSR